LAGNGGKLFENGVKNGIFGRGEKWGKKRLFFVSLFWVWAYMVFAGLGRRYRDVRAARGGRTCRIPGRVVWRSSEQGGRKEPNEKYKCERCEK
jgi:hypothetical protein